MGYITFDQLQLNQPGFTTTREILRTNRAGSYMLKTISGCNTSKYHGLLIVPIENFGGEKHLLLSQLDEIIIQRNTVFPLYSRRFLNGISDPGGISYLKHFKYDKIPRFIYRTGNVEIVKERLLVSREPRILIRYTLTEANAPVIIRLQPFAAFRNIHHLSKANPYVRQETELIANGLRLCLYDGYPYLNLQFNKEVSFVPMPDWYYNFEYEKELNKGEPCHEDLFTPGYFETELKVGESIVFSASTFETDTATLKTRFANELRRRRPHENHIDSLTNAAKQFIWHKGHSDDIVAGYPYYGSKSMQTFVAIPGLRLIQTDRQLGMSVLDTYIPFLNNGLFPASISDKFPVYNSADASLWFIWAVQKLKQQGRSLKDLGIRYGNAIISILNAYREGTSVVNMLENGLLFSAEECRAYTWMDSYQNGYPAVPRYGMPVELNALWYNAICFAIEMAKAAGHSDFLIKWKNLPEMIEDSFMKAFWSNEKGYLADVYNGMYTDWSVRPNMVIAAAMDYTPLAKAQRKLIIDLARHHLLTPLGLRTLSPEDPAYAGMINGQRNLHNVSVHKGAAHPWLLQFYAEAYLDVYNKSGIAHIHSIIDGFRNEMNENCLGTISEYYSGDPPHKGGGALSQAWSVAAILYIMNLLETVEKIT